MTRVPKVISSDDQMVLDLEATAPFVKPGDFVAGILKMATVDPLLYIVEVWGPGEMIRAEQDWRSNWWLKAFGLGVLILLAAGSVGYTFGYMAGKGQLW